jgi:hypothetical protein
MILFKVMMTTTEAADTEEEEVGLEADSEVVSEAVTTITTAVADLEVAAAASAEVPTLIQIKNKVTLHICS